MRTVELIGKWKKERYFGLPFYSRSARQPFEYSRGNSYTMTVRERRNGHWAWKVTRSEPMAPEILVNEGKCGTAKRAKQSCIDALRRYINELYPGSS